MEHGSLVSRGRQIGLKVEVVAAVAHDFQKAEALGCSGFINYLKDLIICGRLVRGRLVSTMSCQFRREESGAKKGVAAFFSCFSSWSG